MGNFVRNAVLVAGITGSLAACGNGSPEGEPVIWGELAEEVIAGGEVSGSLNIISSDSLSSDDGRVTFTDYGINISQAGKTLAEAKWDELYISPELIAKDGCSFQGAEQCQIDYVGGVLRVIPESEALVASQDKSYVSSGDIEVDVSYERNGHECTQLMFVELILTEDENGMRIRQDDDYTLLWVSTPSPRNADRSRECYISVNSD